MTEPATGRDVYNVARWGAGYFDVAADGRVRVRPDGGDDGIDLYALSSGAEYAFGYQALYSGTTGEELAAYPDGRSITAAAVMASGDRVCLMTSQDGLHCPLISAVVAGTW